MTGRAEVASSKRGVDEKGNPHLEYAAERLTTGWPDSRLGWGGVGREVRDATSIDRL